MKNFKQLIPSIILASIVFAGVAFAAWTAPSCVPGATGCNADEPVNIDNEDQLKLGGLTSTYLGSMGYIFSRGPLMVGSSVSTNPTGSLRILSGNAWFNDKVYIGNDASITDSPINYPVTPTDTLTLKSGATTNIGRGNWCTMTKARVTGTSAESCPAGYFIIQINPTATGIYPYVTCSATSPSVNPHNIGSC